MMRSPVDMKKVIDERRAITREKHGVEKVNPLANFTEMDIHKELDNQGGGIKESMLANQEVQEASAKIKRAAEAPQRKKVIKERIEKLEERDRKNGRLEKGKKFQEQAKRRKK